MTRTSAPDTIRAAALVGICIVNLPFLGLPFEAAITPPQQDPDRLAALVVGTLFQWKFFLLFSFVFGWGMGVQALSALRAGVAFGPRYARRLAGLAVLGCLHAVLVFTGDILLLYALLGALLWPLRNAHVATLIRWARAMVGLAVLILLALGLLMGRPEGAVLPGDLGGSFAEAVEYRLADWPGTFVMLLLLQGPLAFGAFCLGLAAARSGFFEAASAGQRWLARRAPLLAALGLAANLAIAFAPADESLAAGLALIAVPLAAPMLSAVWLHLFLWIDARRALPEAILLAGRNSLSTYVLQGILAGAIFGGYGLGLFGSLGQAALLALALGVALAAMLAVAGFARLTGRGPLEHLLHRFTQGGA